jgi:hypothetical protein
VGPPSSVPEDDEQVQRFDVVVLGLELVAADGDVALGRLRRQVEQIATALSEPTRDPGRTVATEVHGYVAAPSPVPPLEAVADPAFAWPDAELPMHGSVVLRTAVPELQALNSTVYGFTGTVNVGRGELRVRAHSLARVLVA